MRILLVLIALLIVTAVACQQNNKGVEGSMSTVVSVADAKQLLGSDAELQLVDVRTPKEHAAGHIAGCTLMDYFGSDFDTQLATLDKTKPVFVYCKSGGRSGKTANKLRGLGFMEIYDLKGGFTAWAAAGEAVEK